MYTGMFDQNWIIFFYRSIGYTIGPTSKLYEDNQSTIKIVFSYRVNPQSSPLDVLSTVLCELHICKIFDMVDTRSNMQLSDINSKPNGG